MNKKNRNRQVHILVRPADQNDPVVIVHNVKDRRIGLDNPAHCFGPFIGVEDAISFMEAMAEANEEDDCIKTVIPMFQPPAIRVVQIPISIEPPTAVANDRRN